MKALLRSFRTALSPAGDSLRTFGRDAFTTLKNVAQNEGLLLFVGAVLMGGIGFGVTIGFRQATSAIQYILYQAGKGELIAAGSAMAWWHLVLITTVGGLVIGLMNRYLNGGRRARGTGRVIERVHLHNGHMNFREGLNSFIIRVVSIGMGSSIGREGAILNMSNTLASAIGHYMPISRQHIVTLLGCVTAAAVGASYNAPIAGVFFSLEVILGGYTLGAFAPVVIAAVIGTMLSRQYYGPEPTFSLPHYEIATYLEFPAFVLLGLICSVLAMVFMWSTFFVEDTLDTTTKRLKLPDYLKPAAGGLALGVIAIAVPQVLGVGYGITNAALNEQLALHWLLLLTAAKLVATAICVGAGFGGGIFSPSFFLGATAGGAFGVIAAGVFPEMDINAGLYAIVGMTSVAGSVLGAPITAILLVFELTGDVQVTIGVMTGTAIAAILTQQILGYSYYTWRIARRGVELKGGRARMILKQTQVRQVCERHFQTVPENMKLNDLKQLLHLVPEDQRMFVVGAKNRLVGSVSLNDIKDVAFDPLVYEEGIEAINVAYVYDEVVTLDDNLEDALAVFERTAENELPVVRDRESLTVEGMLSRQQITQAYNEALLQAEKEYSR